MTPCGPLAESTWVILIVSEGGMPAGNSVVTAAASDSALGLRWDNSTSSGVRTTGGRAVARHPARKDARAATKPKREIQVCTR